MDGTPIQYQKKTSFKYFFLSYEKKFYQYVNKIQYIIVYLRLLVVTNITEPWIFFISMNMNKSKVIISNQKEAIFLTRLQLRPILPMSSFFTKNPILQFFVEQIQSDQKITTLMDRWMIALKISSRFIISFPQRSQGSSINKGGRDIKYYVSIKLAHV